MAWTSMHFAVGMTCTGAAGSVACLLLGRGWRWLPSAMTIGGVWALLPDLPRIFREDFPSLGLASTLGSKRLETFLHGIGDLFFFHHQLDLQPREFALLGLLIILLLYNASIVMMLLMEDRARNSVGNRAWRAHEAHVRRVAAQHGIDGSHDRLRSSHLSRPMEVELKLTTSDKSSSAGAA